MRFLAVCHFVCHSHYSYRAFFLKYSDFFFVYKRPPSVFIFRTIYWNTLNIRMYFGMKKYGFQFVSYVQMYTRHYAEKIFSCFSWCHAADEND